MSRDIKWPPINRSALGTECTVTSKRDPDEGIGQPCAGTNSDGCGHFECHYGYPCPICNIVAVLKAGVQRINQLESRADNGRDQIQAINDHLATHDTRLDNQQTAGQNLAARVTTAENNITANTTSIQTNATQIGQVNNRVTTLKNRVDNATQFPIP